MFRSQFGQWNYKNCQSYVSLLKPSRRLPIKEQSSSSLVGRCFFVFRVIFLLGTWIMEWNFCGVKYKLSLEKKACRIRDHVKALLYSDRMHDFVTYTWQPCKVPFSSIDFSQRCKTRCRVDSHSIMQLLFVFQVKKNVKLYDDGGSSNLFGFSFHNHFESKPCRWQLYNFRSTPIDRKWQLFIRKATLLVSIATDRKR